MWFTSIILPRHNCYNNRHLAHNGSLILISFHFFSCVREQKIRWLITVDTSETLSTPSKRFQQYFVSMHDTNVKRTTMTMSLSLKFQDFFSSVSDFYFEIKAMYVHTQSRINNVVGTYSSGRREISICEFRLVNKQAPLRVRSVLVVATMSLKSHRWWISEEIS